MNHNNPRDQEEVRRLDGAAFTALIRYSSQKTEESKEAFEDALEEILTSPLLLTNLD